MSIINGFDEYSEYKSTIHVKFFPETLSDIYDDNDTFAHLCDVLSNADIYPISENWKNVGNGLMSFRFYSIRKNQMYIVFSDCLALLQTGKRVLINSFIPDYDDYSDIVKAGYFDVNPLIRYEVREIDAWGNKIDGYEYNTTYFMGYFDVKRDIKDINRAFKHYLELKHNIIFKAHKTEIIYDGSIYELVAKSTKEPLYCFIPVEY